MPSYISTPEDLEPFDERITELELKMETVLIVLSAFEYVGRVQAMHILNVSSPTLKSMAEKDTIEYHKGKRKVEYKLSSLVMYRLGKKHEYPHKIKERMAKALVNLKFQ